MKIKELDGKIIGDNLCKLAELLSITNFCKDIGPLNHAGQQCSKNVSNNEWSYKFNNLDFDIEPMGSIIPIGADEMKLRFSINIRGIIENIGDKGEMLDPLKSLCFDLELQGCCIDRSDTYISLSASWHFDKHIKDEDDGKPKYSHPEYHMAFGGRKMEESSHDYGSTLILPTPRLPFPPMDAVLGVNFILYNYFPSKQRKKLTNNPLYIEILKESQHRLWYPYILSLGSHFGGDNTFENSFMPKSLFPLLV